MNKSAKILKLDRTHYSNCHGLMDSRANSTAQNICILSMYAMQN
jgi:D-alanyl-D-alanine carboxypeptidase